MQCKAVQCNGNNINNIGIVKYTYVDDSKKKKALKCIKQKKLCKRQPKRINTIHEVHDSLEKKGSQMQKTQKKLCKKSCKWQPYKIKKLLLQFLNNPLKEGQQLPCVCLVLGLALLVAPLLPVGLLSEEIQDGISFSFLCRRGTWQW